MDSNDNLHVPVLAKEIIEYLRIKKGMVILDCTIGGGGHALDTLQIIGETGYLIGIDRDKDALCAAKKRLEAMSDRFELFHANYGDVASVLGRAGMPKVDGVLFDLGLSSLQIGDAERGFSIKLDGPLDMRMDRGSGTRASDIINRFPKQDLIAIFKEYADEYFAPRIVERIVRERQRQRIESTRRLANIVKNALPYRYRFRKIHPATKVFMALRIAVNKEIDGLRSGLAGIKPFLNSGGRICVISFHSIEDRIVKNMFKESARLDELRIITKKPIRPGAEEMKNNPRSRSAKLRVAEKA